MTLSLLKKTIIIFFVFFLIFGIYFTWPLLLPCASWQWLKTPDSYRSQSFSPPFFSDPHVWENIQRNVTSNPQSYASVLQRLKGEASRYRQISILSVTQKKHLPTSGDIHDYYDIAPYFWPNRWTKSGLPYLLNDGLVNPECKEIAFDRKAFLDLTGAVETLSLDFYLTGDLDSAQHAAHLIRAWFIQPETRMNPHWNHGQAIPGLCSGYTLGVIRGVELVRILDATFFLQKSGAWTSSDQEQIQDWFYSYLDWILRSPFGWKESQRPNNHGTWYDAHVSAISLFTGERKSAEKILHRFSAKRIHHQINEDGDQPQEIKRSRALEYSLFNLKGLFAGALMAERLQINLWDGPLSEYEALYRAYASILKCVETQSFAYQQVLDFDPAPDLFFLQTHLFPRLQKTLPITISPQEKNHRSLLFISPLANP
jgi:hypothetical protein